MRAGGERPGPIDGEGPVTEQDIDVSVVIPARDAAGTISPQLEALVRQETDRRFEVIVVDNGSTDRTAAVAGGFADRLDITVVAGPAEPNRSLARNAGVAVARGPVLAFCDADDEVDPRWLACLCRDVASLGVVTGSFRRASVVDGEPAVAAMRPVFRGFPILSSNNFAIRRDDYNAVGGFNPSFRHRVDVELTCRLLLAGIEVHHEPAALVRYNRRPTLRAEMRQHYHWAVAGARIFKTYRRDVPLSHSWKNSVKHWLLLLPLFVRGVRSRAERHAVALTLATLCGQLVGSVRYRTLYL